MRAILTAATIAVALTGCSSTITAWKGRPFGEHGLGPQDKDGNTPGQLYIMTAERRVALLVPAKDWNHRFCAESLPEAALAVDGDTKIDLTLKPDELGSISDKVDQTLTQTFTRTEKAEILRQLGWQLCQAWAQNVLSNDEYNVELKALVAEGSKILASPTSSSPAQQPAAASTAPPIPPAPKTP